MNRLQGTISEAEFIVQSLKRNFKISKPFDTDCSYDFIIDSGSKLTRVQVKSCSAKSDNYEYPVIELRKSRNKIKKLYSKKEIDIFAIHVKIENSDSFWYLIPVEDAPQKGVIKASLEGKYKIYKENWSVLT